MAQARNGWPGLFHRSARLASESAEVGFLPLYPSALGDRWSESCDDVFVRDDSLHSFEPILLFVAVLIGFVITNLILAHTIGPRRRTAVKEMPYESGMDPIADARQPFDVKFSLVAILFLIFDVELLFLFPWAVSAYAPEGVPASLRHDVFWVMVVFIATLLVPYIYAWRKGIFRWR